MKKKIAMSLFILGALLPTLPVFYSLWNLRRAVIMMSDVKFENSGSQMTWTQAFRSVFDGEFTISWVGPNKLVPNSELDKLNYNYLVKSGSETVGQGAGSIMQSHQENQKLNL